MAESENRFGIERLPSQTTLDERYGLIDLVQSRYSGEGLIYDIGSAAGGSTYCLARGLSQNDGLFVKDKKIKAFDLFDGYSLKAFSQSTAVQLLKSEGRMPSGDIDLFRIVTTPFDNLIEPVQLDLVKSFESYRAPNQIEVAHIDAAKSAQLWTAILPVIADGVMPGKSTWVFQDFERCRLPWQWHIVAELLRTQIAEITGSYEGGTLHLKLHERVPATLLEKSEHHNFDLSEQIELWAWLKNYLHENLDIERVFVGNFDSISKTVLCYIYLFSDLSKERNSILNSVDQDFLSDPENSVYARELSQNN
jgi:hypothetical protein